VLYAPLPDLKKERRNMILKIKIYSKNVNFKYYLQKSDLNPKKYFASQD
jgi:hypothetical protein